MIRSAAHALTKIRPDAPATETEALRDQLTHIRGIHRVELKYRSDLSGWATLFFRGTERAVQIAKTEIAFSGLEAPDQNADHDHADCIARAAAQGVPAEWAHRTETYLSM